MQKTHEQYIKERDASKLGAVGKSPLADIWTRISKGKL